MGQKVHQLINCFDGERHYQQLDGKQKFRSNATDVNTLSNVSHVKIKNICINYNVLTSGMDPWAGQGCRMAVQWKCAGKNMMVWGTCNKPMVHGVLAGGRHGYHHLHAPGLHGADGERRCSKSTCMEGGQRSKSERKVGRGRGLIIHRQY